ncbi:unnamed protein product [Phytophthora fragariaefolia]|uniref:Unnamed protein product n=1 Tax=Phytophthora fragariaefolia TaxID=1490495 RepID=A0A9W6XXL8_9STRA|nr:unnamed protein product [Phytophthora fragariaefolia]
MGDLGRYDGNGAAVGVLVDGVTSNIETADIQIQEARHYNADQGTIGAATIQAAERPRDGGVAGPVSNTQAYRRRSCLADSFNVHVACEREDTGTGSGSRILQLLEEESTASDAATTPSRTAPILLQDVYANKLVAFCPDKEKWMRAKAYRPAGTAYIIGRVQFQKAVEHVSVGVLQRGIKNYSVLIRMKNPYWRILVQPDPTDDIDFEENDSDCEEEEVFKAFDPTESLPTNLEEVEAIRNMRFVPSGEVKAPSYLFQHEKGSTRTYLRPEFKHLFEHSASSSFLPTFPCIFGANFCTRRTST